jgi:hypothetical protein
MTLLPPPPGPHNIGLPIIFLIFYEFYTHIFVRRMHVRHVHAFCMYAVLLYTILMYAVRFHNIHRNQSAVCTLYAYKP